MGIPGFERFLRTHEGCMKDVSIVDLMKQTGRNVIVVDGFNFYGQYIYSKFDWVCGGIKDMVERVREFVDPFKQVGVELEFFFVDGHLDEGIDTCGSATWVQKHSSFVEFTKNFFIENWSADSRSDIERRKHIAEVKEERPYYHTPLHALPVVLSVLHHIVKCKVHFDFPGKRTSNTAYYSRDNPKCLGLLAQDNYYVFFKNMPSYLSLFHLNLNKMSTKQYCADMCARHLNLHENHLYPIFIKPITMPSSHPNRSSKLRSVVRTPHQKRLIVQISTKLNEYDGVHIAREKIEQFRDGSKLTEVFGLKEQEMDKDTETLVSQFFVEVIFYKYGDEQLELPIFGPVRKWTCIKALALYLYKRGKISLKIVHLLLRKEYFNYNILEDFKELPPSSFVYQPLRQQLYGILFLEEENDDSDDDFLEEDNDDSDDDDDNKDEDPNDTDCQQNYDEDNETVRNECNKKLRENSKKIHEWCMTENGCSEEPISIEIKPVDHPGLLELWKFDEADHMLDIKWQLFAKCISNTLNYQLLCKIPTTLVIPTAVLYFLYHEVPHRFKEKHERLLESWELEVFIAQAVMLPKMKKDFFSKLVIQNIRERIVKLSAAFVYGCHTMQLLVEVCGFPVSDHDISLWHYFDGKFFHLMYEKAEKRHNAEDLCDSESCQIFKEIRQIILPQTSSS